MFKSQKRDSCSPLFVRCPWDRDHQISHSAFYDTPSLSFWHLLLNCNLLKKSPYSTALQEMAISISCVWALRNMGLWQKQMEPAKITCQKRKRIFRDLCFYTSHSSKKLKRVHDIFTATAFASPKRKHEWKMLCGGDFLFKGKKFVQKMPPEVFF